MPTPSRLLATFALAFCVYPASCVFAAAKAPGVTDDAITFSQIACFSGMCRTAGLQYRAGILAAFHERNRQGGVNGRTLKLESEDDGYEPDVAAANADKLVVTNNVFAVIGGIGTPTAKRVAPILRTAEIPFVGVLTGADFLRDAQRYPNVVNIRTGYKEETWQLVTHMFNELGARRFGIIYQEDSFGRSVLASYQTALANLDLPILAKATYSRHTHAVHGSVFTMGSADLDAVMLATTTDTAADAINTARSLGHGYVVGLLSFVNIKRLRATVDYRIEPVLITRIVPAPNDESIALVRRFRSVFAAYRKAEPEAAERVPDSISLEGYILGRFVIEVLARMPGELTRKQFLETALTTDPVVIDDWVISFEAGGNSGSKYVRLVNSEGENFRKVAVE